MKAKKILELEGSFIEHDKDTPNGGTWGTFTVNTPTGRHYYCHVNAAIEKFIKDTGFDIDQIEAELEGQEHYTLEDHSKYKDKVKMWNKLL